MRETHALIRNEQGLLTVETQAGAMLFVNGARVDNARTAALAKPGPNGVYVQALYSHDKGAEDELAVEAEKMIEETRTLLAEFFGFGGDPHQVVFTQNATDSLNIAFFGLIESGDHVVTTRLEHNSVLRPLAHLKRDHGVQVTHVGGDEQGYVDPEDVRAIVHDVLRHRLMLSYQANASGVSANAVIDELLKHVAVA